MSYSSSLTDEGRLRGRNLLGLIELETDAVLGDDAAESAAAAVKGEDADADTELDAEMAELAGEEVAV